MTKENDNQLLTIPGLKKNQAHTKCDELYILVNPLSSLTRDCVIENQQENKL